MASTSIGCSGISTLFTNLMNSLWLGFMNFLINMFISSLDVKIVREMDTLFLVKVNELIITF